jgi:hypothetical protein
MILHALTTVSIIHLPKWFIQVFVFIDSFKQQGTELCRLYTSFALEIMFHLIGTLFTHTY